MFRQVLGLAVALYAGAAFAGDQAQYAPPGLWVKPAEIPQPSADDTTDVQMLLEDFQTNFGADGDDFYEEIAERTRRRKASKRPAAWFWNGGRTSKT